MNNQTDIAIAMGKHLINTRDTTLKIAKEFGVSKTTVLRMLNVVLPNVSYDLATQCRVILDYNKSVAYIRGGEGNKIAHRKARRSEGDSHA
jgi:hypothetical protein